MKEYKNISKTGIGVALVVYTQAFSPGTPKALIALHLAILNKSALTPFKFIMEQSPDGDGSLEIHGIIPEGELKTLAALSNN